MPTSSFNVLWLLCVLLVVVAFLLALRRRRMAKKTDANQNLNQTTYIRDNGQEVRIHMTRTLNPITVDTNIQPPPPAFDREEPPPPSYQDFNKDVLIQPSHNV